MPDVPGCFSAGNTLDEALANTKTAIQAHIELLVGDGESLPVASSVTTHKSNKDYADGIWALVNIDISQFSMKTEKINATLPARVIHQIDELVAAGEYKSRSSFLAETAMQKLAGWRCWHSCSFNPNRPAPAGFPLLVDLLPHFYYTNMNINGTFTPRLTRNLSLTYR